MKELKQLKQKAAIERRLNSKNKTTREHALYRLVELGYRDIMCLPAGSEEDYVSFLS